MNIRSEAGQAAALTAVFMTVLLGSCAAVLDVGSWFRADRDTQRIADAAALAVKNGIEPHAGHGLTFDNVVPVAAIPQLAELNIGHFLVGEAIFGGLGDSVRRMRALMDEARG